MLIEAASACPPSITAAAAASATTRLRIMGYLLGSNPFNRDAAQSDAVRTRDKDLAQGTECHLRRERKRHEKRWDAARWPGPRWTRTGLFSPIQSSRHSGNSVDCLRSAPTTKRFIDPLLNHRE